MSYQQKIVPDQGGYKGLLLLNGEVVYTTEKCSTLKQAADKIRQHMARGAVSTASKQLINKAPISFTYNPPTAPPSPRRCCGR